jgi:hypothetical protein
VRQGKRKRKNVQGEVKTVAEGKRRQEEVTALVT